MNSTTTPLYRFCWANNPKRAIMQGRTCRVMHRGAMNSAMIEFIDNGQREIVSRNALRRTGERQQEERKVKDENTMEVY